mgnify:CR=1 FL=1
MITEIDASLLEKIADLTGKPVGAFNIRKDSGCEARQSTEHIAIDPQPEGKSGIIIRIKDGTKGEQCHIPVINQQERRDRNGLQRLLRRRKLRR